MIVTRVVFDTWLRLRGSGPLQGPSLYKPKHLEPRDGSISQNMHHLSELGGNQELQPHQLTASELVEEKKKTRKEWRAYRHPITRYISLLFTSPIRREFWPSVPEINVCSSLRLSHQVRLVQEKNLKSCHTKLTGESLKSIWSIL